MLDPEEMAEYQSMTPTTLDSLADYSDAVDRMPYVLGATPLSGGTPYSSGRAYVPGATESEGSASAAGVRYQSFQSYANNVLAFDTNRLAGSSHHHKPRGSYKIDAIWAYGPGSTVAREVLSTDNTVYVQFTVTETLLLSPFTFGNRENKQGFYGISNLTFNFNMMASASRAWRCCRWGTQATSKVAQVVEFKNSTLTFTFLTAHPSLRLSSRNVVPFYELPIYKTVQGSALPGRAQTISWNSNVSPPRL